jgi:hypothetical protein
MARYVGVTVFKNGGDIRDVISIGKLIRKKDGPDDIEKLLSTMSRYGGENSSRTLLSKTYPRLPVTGAILRRFREGIA